MRKPNVLVAIVALVLAFVPGGMAQAGGGDMSLDEAHGEVANIPPSSTTTDAVSGSAPIAGTWGFWGKLENDTAANVTNAVLGFNSGYPTTGFAVQGNQPVTAWPTTLSGSTLLPGGANGLFLGLSSPLPVTRAPGFDSNRSVDVLNVPAAGLRQTTTVSVTLTDPRYGTMDHYLKLALYAPVPGTTFVSLTSPAMVGTGDAVQTFVGPNNWQFVLSGGVLGHTYQFSVTVQVPNTSGVTFAHKLQVNALSVLVDAPTCVLCGPQPSIQLAEPVLDGASAGSGYASGAISESLTWQTRYSETFTVAYGSMNATVPPPPVPCNEEWTFSFTERFAPGTWSIGTHSYDIRTTADHASGAFHRTFTVDPSAPVHAGDVRLGPYGLSSVDGGVSAINPDQRTRIEVTWLFPRLTYQEIRAIADLATATFRWDGGPWHLIDRSPITTACVNKGDDFLLRSGGPAREKRANEATIVSSLPLTGSASSFTGPIVDAILMALDDAGWRASTTHLSYVSLNDANPTTGRFDLAIEADNATLAASDPSVIAYIGPFNSPAAKVSIPILCQAGIGMVSPTNSYGGLTKAAPYNDFPDEPGRYYPNGCTPNYTRVYMRDALEGSEAAVLAQRLGRSRAYVVDTGWSYPRATAAGFVDEAATIGLTIVGRETVPQQSASYATLGLHVAASGADIVFVGAAQGVDAAGRIVRDIRAAAPGVMIIGGDALVGAPQFFGQAGSAAEGVYALQGRLEVADYAGAIAAWHARYESIYGPSAIPFAAYGFEATNALLAAVAGAGHDPDRAAVRDALRATHGFSGIFGTWSFDGDGDTTVTISSYVRATSGTWTDIGTVSLP